MLSLVIPIYNSEQSIGRTLDSILTTVSLLSEVIVVDDCSSDNSRQVVSKIISTDSRVKLLEMASNSGPGPARNVGLEHASAPYVMFADSDDIVIGRTVDLVVQNLDRFHIDMAICPYNLQRSRDHRTQGSMHGYDVAIFEQIFSFEDIRIIDGALRYDLLKITNYPWNKIFNTTYAKKAIRYPKHRLHEDILPHWQGILGAKNILVLNAPLVKYFLSPFGGNLSNDRSVLRLELVDVLSELQRYVLGRDGELASYFSFIDFASSALIWALEMINPEYKKKFARNAMNFLASQPIDLFNMALQKDRILTHRIADILGAVQ